MSPIIGGSLHTPSSEGAIRESKDSGHLLVALIASSLLITLYATGFITLPFGPQTTPKTTFKSTNTTATNQLLINSTEPAIQSVTVQGCNLSTVTMSNVKFPSNWFEVTVNASESCTVVVNLDYSAPYTVTWSGLSSGTAWSCCTVGSAQLTIYTNFRVTNVHLAYSYSYTSSTNVTMFLRNNGNATATLVSYNVTDIYGNTWTRTGWIPSTIAPNMVVPINFLIGSSCPSCIYSGTSNAFNGFAIGYSYYITVVISTGQSFRYSIVR